MQLNSKKRVVITGMGVISTFGFNIKDFWENIKIGKNNAGDQGTINRYATVPNFIDLSEVLGKIRPIK